MTGIRRRTVFGTALGVMLALLAFVALINPTLVGLRGARFSEVAVLQSHGNADGWNRTVRAAQTVAVRKQATPNLVDRMGERQISFETPSRQILFRAYACQGSLGLATKTEELCARANPPIAFIAGNNSKQARAVAEKLAANRSSTSPVLFITSGTVDDLMKVYAGKTFRVGYRNSVQAKTVVSCLKKRYADKQIVMPPIDALVVEVEDNPYAKDLVGLFRNELKAAFPDCVRIHPWKLPTEGGGFEEPTQDEMKLARKLVKDMCDSPGQLWVWVLPVGTDCFRRLQFALAEAFRSVDNLHFELARENLTVLSGDSLDVEDFRRADLIGLHPETTAPTTIFFGQEHPTPEKRAALYGVTGLASQIVGEVLADFKETPTPEALIAALETWKLNSSDPQPFFENHERRGKGFAVVAAPSCPPGGTARFDIEPK